MGCIEYGYQPGKQCTATTPPQQKQGVFPGYRGWYPGEDRGCLDDALNVVWMQPRGQQQAGHVRCVIKKAFTVPVAEVHGGVRGGRYVCSCVPECLSA